MVEARVPERGLADAGLADEHKCGRSRATFIDEGADGGDLRLPPNDREHGPPLEDASGEEASA